MDAWSQSKHLNTDTMSSKMCAVCKSAGRLVTIMLSHLKNGSLLFFPFYSYIFNITKEREDIAQFAPRCNILFKKLTWLGFKFWSSQVQTFQNNEHIQRNNMIGLAGHNELQFLYSIHSAKHHGLMSEEVNGGFFNGPGGH